MFIVSYFMTVGIIKYPLVLSEVNFYIQLLNDDCTKHSLVRLYTQVWLENNTYMNKRFIL